MSKKKRRQLCLLLVILAAAVVLLAAVLLYNRYLAAREAAAGADTISTGLAAEPVQLSWTGAGGSVALVQDGEGNWSWAEDESFPLDSSLVQSIVSALADPAQREIELADSLEAYGLEEPAWTLTTVDGEGNEAQLLIGNSFTEAGADTGESTEYYYAMVPGSETLLILDTTLADQLTGTVLELADTSPLEAIEESQVTSLTIQGAQESVLTVQSETVEDEEGSEETEYHWYSGDTDVTDSALLTSLTGELLDPAFTSMAYWKPDEAALAACGLDAPITATVAYTDGDGKAAVRTLSIGSLDEEGSSYYCTADGGESVYLIRAASLADTVTVAASGFNAAAESAGAEEA